MIQQRIAALREKMKQYGIDFYYIPTSDDHNSEYTADKYMVRKFMSGFTGSAGTLIVGLETADLWTDGRYFVQAQRQLEGSGITLQKMGQEGVPTVDQFLQEHVKDKMTIGFDGTVVMENFARHLHEMFDAHQVKIVSKDLCSDLWTDCPQLPNKAYWILGERYTGVSAQDKVATIRSKALEQHCDAVLLTQLEDVAYTTNLRGHDVECTPVFYGYMLIDAASATLYCDVNKVGVEVDAYLQENGINVKEEAEIYHDVEQLRKCTLWTDLGYTNVSLAQRISKDVTIHDAQSPVVIMRAIKNETEIKNLKKAHVLDGLAVTKFMYWLKTNVKKMEMDEYSAQVKLEEFRRENTGFIEPSFTTISAYGPNAAMMHYSAPKEGSAKIEPKDFLLVDSGGQYVYGTTDITRTFVCGKTDRVHKKWFTMALKSYLNLMRVRFLYGCSGLSLDCIARNALWQVDMDYQCGTGHGVGYCLGVHEGPQGFRWRTSPLRKEDTVFEAGMVVTNEPGVYLPNELGIRHENQMIVAKGTKNEYGQFMYLENLTMAPIDLDGVDVKLLTSEEIDTLNKYHALVYRHLNRYFNGKELAWLKKVTRAINA